MNTNSANEADPAQTTNLRLQKPQAKLPDRIDISTADRALNEQQREACNNALDQSKHVSVKLMPNHHLGTDGSLRGFVFSCSAQDSAQVLPLTPELFECTCIYETTTLPSENGFNVDAMRLTADIAGSKARLRQCLQDIQNSELDPATFDCIATKAGQAHKQYSMASNRDTREWIESMPLKAGVYHSYVRTTSKERREHKVYIVITGSLTHAAEELHALWQDTCKHVTCDMFQKSEEVHWLRSATVRNNSRIAAKIAKALDLSCRCVDDPHAVTPHCKMVMPTSITMRHDIQASADGKVSVSNCACFPDKTLNGIAFDMFSAEGVWIFCGPPDHQSYNSFGTQFSCTKHSTGFPTHTVHFNKHYPANNRTNVVRAQSKGDFLFPGEEFQKTLEKLGFNRNNGTLNLMPIIVLES